MRGVGLGWGVRVDVYEELKFWKNSKIGGGGGGVGIKAGVRVDVNEELDFFFFFGGGGGGGGGVGSRLGGSG